MVNYPSFLTNGGNKGIQERSGSILTEVFHYELDVWILRIDVLEELVTMFCLLDDESVIYVPE